MIGMVSSHIELEYHIKEFEAARARHERWLAQQGQPLRSGRRSLGPLLFLVLKSAALVQLYRLALEGGVPQ
ncbi:MAG TPA: hypothetical protein VFP05_16280 [Thermomicrobiales bacterium]|nr:hypothetical protein [Thermomicrobiales bacterium]